MATPQTDVLDKLQTLAKTAGNIAGMWLYGSRARGLARDNSDYDLAVQYTDYKQEPLESRLRPELLAQQWQQKMAVEISIVDIQRVPVPLAYTIICDNQLLFAADPIAVLHTERNILSKWELDYQYHVRAYV